MKHLDLFSGIGGFALAARWVGIETVQFVEIEPYAQKVLTKNFPEIPIHDNIKTFDATKFRGIDLLTGGYPCQPFSQAGKRRGEEDDRHLWPEMFRVIREARPDWVLAENVAGHVSMGLDDVLDDLEGEGYTTQSIVIPACAKDAKHRRDRVWIVANSNSGFSKREDKGIFTGRNSADNGSKYVANSNSTRFREQWRPESIQSEFTSPQCDGRTLADADGSRKAPSRDVGRMGWKSESIENIGNDDFERWLPEPDVGRVAHGIPSRVDRLRGLGNAIVPQVAYEIMKGIYDTNN